MKTEKFVKYFMDGCKEAGELNVGLEVEHFIVNCESHETMVYEGEHGVAALMERLSAGYPEKHLEEGMLIGLESDDILITLEPGCQLEISTAPFASIDQVMDVYHRARLEVKLILDGWGYELVTKGYLPYKKAEDVPLIGKERYRCMNRYFEQTGRYGKNMMRATAACHVSVDYFDEEDFVRKYRLAWLLDPLFALLTENVSCFEGEVFDGHLLRDTIWQGVDPERVCMCPDTFSEDFGFDSYAKWLMDVPVIVMHASDRYVYEPDKTIGQCMDSYGDSEDCVKHYLSMVFPDVRLKQFIEIRSADSMPENYVKAYCALVKGIFSSEETIRDMLLVLPESVEAVIKAKENIKKDGYDAEVYGLNARLILHWMLGKAEENLEGTEKAALEVWYEHINQ
ncbi:MAG: glutamate-cysteine ligase family protein [Frisingicoccus sp.]|uniref:glutamate-cysteine ligase family protein n=1 Tax=Frisingicoccus sp. TaxID=1918627 RepID=UPI002A82A2A7|nr:glutamate-cysteine ligase family protein [Frisingicoccus sp.]MDY4835556.1 glutamate-cysteine ligase family protein [Frisingicoccus sp.]